MYFGYTNSDRAPTRKDEVRQLRNAAKKETVFGRDFYFITRYMVGMVLGFFFYPDRAYTISMHINSLRPQQTSERVRM